jgi:hypothetical protein
LADVKDSSPLKPFGQMYRNLPSFSTFGQTVSEGKNLKKSANQKKESPVVAMFVNGSRQNEQSK